MNAVEFSGKIKKGLIKVPKEFEDFDNASVRIILLFEDETTIDSKKEKLRNTFSKMKKETMFSSIQHPVSWQKKLRDEWE
jgi:predicted  nucleic acid-binding Zn-ribbon protein